MIDNTVYCEWASPEDLLAHLPEGWREFATGGGGNVALLPARPTLNPDGERQAALMAGEEGVPFPGRRLEDVQRMLDVQGIERAVLTPGPVLRGSTIRNHYYALAINRAANDWMIDACLGGSDRRLFGTLVVSNRLPGEAATEIRRLGANDRIVAVTMAGGGLGKLYGHPVYHPIYEAAADLDLPVVIHVGGNLNIFVSPPAPGGIPGTFVEHYALRSNPATQHLCSLVCQGVFERFQRLRVLITGAGPNWLPSFLWRFDEEFRSQGAREMPWLKGLPSDYIRDHVQVSTYAVPGSAFSGPMIRALNTVDWIPDVLSFGSGHPNWDVNFAGRVAASLPEQWRASAMRENAARFFRWGSAVGLPG